MIIINESSVMNESEIRTRAIFGNVSGKYEPARRPAAEAAAEEVVTRSGATGWLQGRG
jgi:hypothetical protein